MQLQSLLTQVGRDSRAYKQLESRLQGERDNIELKRKEVLRRLFDGELGTAGARPRNGTRSASTGCVRNAAPFCRPAWWN